MKCWKCGGTIYFPPQEERVALHPLSAPDACIGCNDFTEEKRENYRKRAEEYMKFKATIKKEDIGL